MTVRASVELEHIGRQHLGNASPTLQDVSARFEAGTINVILGVSGAGKSTLLNCILGTEPVDCGIIHIDGKTVHGDAIDPRLIGGMLQDPSLFQHLTVLENLTLAPRLVLKLSRAEADARAMALLAYWGIADKADCYPCHLSGGEAQRAGLARALMMQPRILVLDEPTNALNEEWITVLAETLRQLAVADGVTVIVSTHHRGFAAQIADTCYRLQTGGKLALVEDLGARRIASGCRRLKRINSFCKEGIG